MMTARAVGIRGVFGEELAGGGCATGVGGEGRDVFGWFGRGAAEDVFEEPGAAEDGLGIDAVGGDEHDGGHAEEAAVFVAGRKGVFSEGGEVFLGGRLVVFGFEVGGVFVVPLGEVDGGVVKVGIDEGFEGEILAEDFGEEGFGFAVGGFEFGFGEAEAGVGHEFGEEIEIEPLTEEGADHGLGGGLGKKAVGFAFEDGVLGKAGAIGKIDEGLVGWALGEEEGEAGGKVVIVEGAVAEISVKESRRDEDGAEEEVHAIVEVVTGFPVGGSDGEEAVDGGVIDGTAEGAREEVGEELAGEGFVALAGFAGADELAAESLLSDIIGAVDEFERAFESEMVEFEGGAVFKVVVAEGVGQVEGACV